MSLLIWWSYLKFIEQGLIWCVRVQCRFFFFPATEDVDELFSEVSPTDDVEEEIDAVIEGGNERNTSPSNIVLLVPLPRKIKNCMKRT